ncbi:unnamed protein product [Brassicogethes aeneus]|uniref:Uncharacterized protein n=1 Tax=Brassicogethes aeneus TaxID=1431903 RepID=A0A9P0AYI0_BRAAE|nr:unnamed protein product [Brassicogethes aeneus]
MFNLKLVYLFALVLAIVNCKPLYEDSDTAAAGEGHYGRVQMKVYRGPTEHDGHDHFAPWGYWVKQPADDGHHY